MQWCHQTLYTNCLALVGQNLNKIQCDPNTYISHATCVSGETDGVDCCGVTGGKDCSEEAGGMDCMKRLVDRVTNGVAGGMVCSGVAKIGMVNLPCLPLEQF